MRSALSADSACGTSSYGVRREAQYYWILEQQQKLWPGLPKVHIWDYSRCDSLCSHVTLFLQRILAHHHGCLTVQCTSFCYAPCCLVCGRVWCVLCCVLCTYSAVRKFWSEAIEPLMTTPQLLLILSAAAQQQPQHWLLDQSRPTTMHPFMSPSPPHRPTFLP